MGTVTTVVVGRLGQGLAWHTSREGAERHAAELRAAGLVVGLETVELPPLPGKRDVERQLTPWAGGAAFVLGAVSCWITAAAFWMA